MLKEPLFPHLHAALSKVQRFANLLLQEMDLLVEEDFLDVLVALARNMPLEDIWQTGLTPAHTSLLHQDHSRAALQVSHLSVSTDKALPGAVASCIIICVSSNNGGLMTLLQDLLSVSSTRQLGSGGQSNRKWYFEKLIVQVISRPNWALQCLDRSVDSSP